MSWRPALRRTAPDSAAEPPGADEVGTPEVGDGSSTSVPPNRARTVIELVGRFAVIGSFVVMCIVFVVIDTSGFANWSTVKSLLDQAAVPVILATALTFVLVVGEFDLSFTAVIGGCAALVIKLMADSHFAVAPAIVVTIAAAAVCGVLIGCLVTYGRASSFIVTLAIGSVVGGLEIELTNQQTIYTGIPSGFGKIASGTLLGIHWPVWVALVVMLLGVVLLHATRFGRHARATGGNRMAAYLAGVRSPRVIIVCFMLTSIAAAICAVILTSRASSYYPDAAGDYLLNTYAAAFLGAAAGTRNRFTVAGSTLGVIWLATLQTGLTVDNAPPWISSFAQGLVLAVAVLIAARGTRARVV